MTSNAVDSSRPDIVYGDILQSQEPIQEPADSRYANPSSNNNREVNDAVIYSDLLRKDNDTHTAAPLYSQVQKRKTLYPP